jgi:hypothetical protein
MTLIVVDPTIDVLVIAWCARVAAGNTLIFTLPVMKWLYGIKTLVEYGINLAINVPVQKCAQCLGA